jgi:hypothetical protein
MEVFVLMADTIAFGLLLLWVARGRGDQGLFGWKPPPGRAPPTRPGLRR